MNILMMILKYLYDNYENDIHNFTCYNDRVYSYTEYRARRRERPTPQRVKIPLEDKIGINYEYKGNVYNIDIDIRIEKNSNDNYIQLNGNHDEREELMRTIKISGDNKDESYMIF